VEKILHNEDLLFSGLLTQNCSVDKIKNSEIGRTCGTYRGEIHTGFWWPTLIKIGHLEDLSVDGRIILK
jgi:hypothetical protein